MKICNYNKISILNTFNCKSAHYLFIIAFSITMVGLSSEIVNTFPIHMIQAQTGNGSGNTQINGPEKSNFVMSGPLSSFIKTPISDWVVNGNWSLKVQNGKLISFDAQMRWDPTNLTKNTTISHGHTFSNFKVQSTNTSIALGPKNMMDIQGFMDVGAGAKKDNWKDVPSEIKTAGQTITITLDDLKTGHHFNQYPIFGKIVTTKQSNIQSVNNTPKQINAKFDFNKNPITRGETQTFNLVAFDSSNNKVAGIHINSVILPSSEIKKINAINLTNSIFTDTSIKKIHSFNGTTDSNGQFSYSWQLDKKFKPGTITIVTQISAPGYQPLTKATTFIENKK
jgi:hypothetical protein